MSSAIEHPLTDRLTATDELTAFIQQGLESGRFAPGARLPTERQLAEILGMSRVAVRRALAHQEALGAVIRHQGRGTFLAPQGRRAVHIEAGADGDDWADTSPSEVMVVRTIFEPQVAMLAAQSATERDLERIAHCLREAGTAPSFEEFEAWDGALHRAIAESTHNAFLLRVFDRINKVREEVRWGQLKRRSLTPERRQLYDREHGAIVQAIRDRDPDEARAAMSRHLERVRSNMLNPERVGDD